MAAVLATVQGAAQTATVMLVGAEDIARCHYEQDR